MHPHPQNPGSLIITVKSQNHINYTNQNTSTLPKSSTQIDILKAAAEKPRNLSGLFRANFSHRSEPTLSKRNAPMGAEDLPCAEVE